MREARVVVEVESRISSYHAWQQHVLWRRCQTSHQVCNLTHRGHSLDVLPQLQGRSVPQSDRPRQSVHCICACNTDLSSHLSIHTSSNQGNCMLRILSKFVRRTCICLVQYKQYLHPHNEKSTIYLKEVALYNLPVLQGDCLMLECFNSTC